MSQIISLKGAIGFSVFLTLACLPKTHASEAKQPNFVFFLVDDLGWGAMGRYGHPFHETPNFDRLCDSGMRFTHAYSACTVCSPSRAAIMTAQYPGRLRLTDWIPGHSRSDAKLKIPDWDQQVAHDHTTLPEAFSAAGYRTAFLGKWHLMPNYRKWSQEQRQEQHALHTPQRHGFDVNIAGREWGQPKGRGRYFAPFDMPGLKDSPSGEYLTDRLTDEAIGQLESFGDDPFLMYLSYYTVHGPLMAKTEDVEHFTQKIRNQEDDAQELKRRATYAAMHKSLDESVGRVVDKLDALGKLDNTIILFTGDNGGDRHDACGGLRGRKGLAFEGGVREPTCIVWPGVVEARSKCDTPIIGMDIFPTLLEMAGLDAMPQQCLDGVSLVPLLKQSGGIDRDTLFWHYPHYHRTKPYGAVRRGDWKLIEFFEDRQWMLFDLASDPQEERDLVEEKPELATELCTILQNWREEVGAQMPIPQSR